MDRPKVGLGVLIIKDDKVLLGRRKSKHGVGTWSPPGGHLEFGESFEECARRETSEECGLEINNIKFLDVTNDIHLFENKHYVTVVMKADYVSGVPSVLEPDKCEVWDWFSWDNLPLPMFLAVENFIKMYPDFKRILDK